MIRHKKPIPGTSYSLYIYGCTDKYPGLESFGFSCQIIVTGSNNIFKIWVEIIK